MTGNSWSRTLAAHVCSACRSSDMVAARVPQGSASKDLQWGAYFDNPGEFYDNRVSKTNPKGPDFVSKDRCVGRKLSPNADKDSARRT